MTLPTMMEGLAPMRKSAGLTQFQLSEQLGVNRATLAMWEIGKSWPSAQLLPALAGLLSCSIEDLYVVPAPPDR